MDANTAPRAETARPPIGRRLGDLVLTDGLVTEEQFRRVLAEQRRTGERVGEILIRLGLLSESQLIHFLSRQYGIPEASVPDTIAPEIIAIIPVRVARKYEVVPIGRTIGSVTLAVSDPTNLSTLDDVAFITGLKVMPVIAAPSVIQAALQRYYGLGPATLADVLTEMGSDTADVELVDGREPVQPLDLNELRSSADQVPVVRLVNSIVLDAMKRGASDIHFDPGETTFRIRFRVDGLLHQVMTPPKRVEAAVISRIKIMANLDIAERRLPQDGRIKLRQSQREVDFRVSVLPTIFGESVTLRILDRGRLQLDLDDLGFDAPSRDVFDRAIHAPHGMVLITGPTGSGKTTTLYSALHAINRGDRNIVTVEDPVESDLRGVTQVQVDEAIGRTFAALLRSFMRHDPDVILVGEMRDEETAQIAVRAALTGHLVLSTVHTNDSASTVARLSDMGVPSFLVASTLRLVVAQRLVRKVCRECREAYDVDEESLVPHGHTPTGCGRITLFRGRGCASCHLTGMKGRCAIYELLAVTPEIRSLILNHTFAADIEEVARRQGLRTLREAGLAKVLEGSTTLEEVLRVTSD